MQHHRPSPALVVSTIALVVALTGTAVATNRLLITSSSQIKDGAVTGRDIRKGTITSRNLSSALRRKTLGASSVGAPAPAGATTVAEAHRLLGPESKGGSLEIAQLRLTPGAYAVSAKTTLLPIRTDNGLLETLLRDNKTVVSHCNLDVAGTGDYAAAPVTGPGTLHEATLYTQATRTIDAPGTVTLTCRIDETGWKATNTSIIALRVSGASRTELSRP